MYKLANQIIDIYDDVLKEGMRKVAEIMPSIKVMSPQEKAALEDTDFALSIITKEAQKINKFPISDYDSTWLSNQYFDMNHRNLPAEAQKIASYHIKKACDRHSIEPTKAVAGICLEDRYTPNIYFEEDVRSVKVAAQIDVDMSMFAEVEKIASNYTSAQYVMSSPGRVKLAEQYFNEYYKKMPFDIRAGYASAIQKRASELGMDKVGGAVGVYSSDSYSAHLGSHISSRKALLEAKPEDALLLGKLAAMKDHLSPKEFSDHLYSFDKKAGLTKYYDGYLTNAYEATLGLHNPNPSHLYKTARATLDSNELKKIAFGKYDKIKQYMGQSVADEFKKYPDEIFESLPMDHKELVVKIAYGEL